MTVNGLNDALLKLEELIQKLPGPVQKAVLNEVRPLREMFLEQRSPRLLLAGESGTPESVLVRSLFGRVVCGDSDTVSIKTLGPSWFEFRREGRGAVRVMDLRGEGDGMAAQASKTLAAEPPDTVLYIQEQFASGTGNPASLDSLEKLIGQIERQNPGRRIGVIGIGISESTPIDDAREKVQMALYSRALLADRTIHVEAHRRAALLGAIESGESNAELHRLLIALCEALPNAAKVEMARITSLKEVQSAIAHSLIRSASAVCGAVGTQPIPLADLPVLTSIQVAMLAGIIHLSGREFSAKVIIEFLGALGINVGLGLAFREGARAVVKFLPGWGNAISGMVAAGGTYAIGKAANAYFVEGISMQGARKIFLAGKKKRKKGVVPELPNRPS